jgi:hypothetical protein
VCASGRNSIFLLSGLGFRVLDADFGSVFVHFGVGLPCCVFMFHSDAGWRPWRGVILTVWSDQALFVRFLVVESVVNVVDLCILA